MSNYKIQRNMVVMSADEFDRLMKDYESLQAQVKSLTTHVAELTEYYSPTESERDEVEQARSERAAGVKTIPHAEVREKVSEEGS